MNVSAARLWLVAFLVSAAACGGGSAKENKTLVSKLSASKSSSLCEEISDTSVQQGLSEEFAGCTLEGLDAESRKAGSCEATRKACLSGVNDAIFAHASANCRLERCTDLTVGDVRRCNEAYDELAPTGVSFDCASAARDVEAFLDAEPPAACANYIEKCGF